jgi:hypothetical protein
MPEEGLGCGRERHRAIFALMMAVLQVPFVWGEYLNLPTVQPQYRFLLLILIYTIIACALVLAIYGTIHLVKSLRCRPVALSRSE